MSASSCSIATTLDHIVWSISARLSFTALRSSFNFLTLSALLSIAFDTSSNAFSADDFVVSKFFFASSTTFFALSICMSALFHCISFIASSLFLSISMISCAFFSLDFFVLDSASILASASSFIAFILASSSCFSLLAVDHHFPHHHSDFVTAEDDISTFFANHHDGSYAFGQNCD